MGHMLSLSKASKNLGPKVKTVVGVTGDLMFFMIILTPFMFGFGVACQSIMYTNEWRFDEVFFGTFVKELVKNFHKILKIQFLEYYIANFLSTMVKPFYSMFGELWLGENTNYYFTATGRIEYWEILSSAENHLRSSETTGLISLNQNEVFNLTLKLKLVKVYV